ncbi:MAG: hypothetical protein RSB50_09995, partial [Cetobacterium sp.]
EYLVDISDLTDVLDCGIFISLEVLKLPDWMEGLVLLFLYTSIKSSSLIFFSKYLDVSLPYVVLILFVSISILYCPF